MRTVGASDFLLDLGGMWRKGQMIVDDEEVEGVDELLPEADTPFADNPKARRRASDAELEAQYDVGPFRVVTQLNNFLIPAIIQAIKEDQYLNVHPLYQRRLRWDAGRQSLLIESLLMNVPIPPVFFYETDLAKYEVVDGQQRLATLDDFFSNRLELRGLQYWPGLNGRRFRDLPVRIQQAFYRRSISAIILLTESSIHSDSSNADVRRIVFERLNTGGVRLNAQEVRNAVYASPFNDLIHDLARDDLFTEAWGIPRHGQREEVNPSRQLSRNLLYKSMGDCELVLRFFALSDTAELATSMKRTLDEAMKTRMGMGQPALSASREEFVSALSLATQIYGGSVFRLPPKGRTNGRPSKPLYDAVMVGLRETLRAASTTGDGDAISARLLSRRSEIQAATFDLLSDPDSTSYSLLVGRRNTKASIIERIALLKAVFAKHV